MVVCVKQCINTTREVTCTPVKIFCDHGVGVITPFTVITSIERHDKSDHTSDHASDRDGLL